MIFRSFLFLLNLAAFVSADLYRDTITVASDSTGPFFLPRYFYQTNSAQISSDSTVPPSRFFYSDCSIRFESPVKAGTTLFFSAERTYGSLKQNYYFLKPIQYDSAKTYQNVPISSAFATVSSDQQVQVSGEKSVGIHLGQGGEFSMDQTLDVKMQGKISDSTTLSANISDQSTSLEGDTKELGEIDRIFLSIEHPRYDVTAGDLSISTEPSGLLHEQKSPKGLGGGFKSKVGEFRSFVGVSGQKMAVEYLTGISGIQSGAYTLKGNGEPGQIIPVEGSVELSVQGKKLVESGDGDFTIDYTAGRIRFTPKFTVIDGDMIEIRYRYKQQNYSKFNGGTSWKCNIDSIFSINTSILIDKDNQNSSATILSKSDRDSMVNGGDSAPKILSGQKINPNDISKESARNRIYRMTSDSTGYIFESKPITQAQISDLYLVTFTKTLSGEYLPFNQIYRETLNRYYSKSFLDSVSISSNDSLFLQPIYCKVPKGVGTHTAYHTAPLPNQLVQGEIITKFTPSDQFSIKAVIAGKAHDRNTVSSKDDEDNNSGAFTGSFTLSTPPKKRFTLASQGDFFYAGTEFIHSVNRFDLSQKWGVGSDSCQLATGEGVVTAAEKTFGSITIGAGHAEKNHESYSSIVHSKIAFIPNRAISPFYSILYRTSKSYSAQPGRRQETGIQIRYPKIESHLSVEEEWLERSAEISRGYLKEVATISLPKIGLTESVENKRIASGKAHRTAEEFGTYLLWKQELSRTIRDQHQFTITTSLLNQTGTDRDGITVLLSTNKKSRYLDNRAATDLRYTINSENATARRWQYLYVGQGIGTHVRDSITGEFIPAPFGDYIAKEIVLWGDGTKRTVQNGFTYHWSWNNRSRSKLSDGFTLEGVLNSQEDIVPKGEIGSALVPMISTFSKISNDTVSYSLISYLQQIGWAPTQRPGFSTSIQSQVSRKADLESTIRHFEGSGSIRKEWDSFVFATQIRGIMEKRNQLDIRDASLEPVQEFPIRKIVVPFIEETFGRTSLEDSVGYYLAGRPGIRFTPKKYGTAELSYTLANLFYNGVIIYPMAKDFLPGINHRIYLTLSMNTTKYLSFTGFFRGDYSEQRDWRFMTSLRASVKF